MIKTITKVGNSQGIIFDNAIMQLARLKTGDQVNLEIHSGGAITLTPMNPRPNGEAVSDAIQDVMKRYAKTMQRLA